MRPRAVFSQLWRPRATLVATRALSQSCSSLTACSLLTSSMSGQQDEEDLDLDASGLRLTSLSDITTRTLLREGEGSEGTSLKAATRSIGVRTRHARKAKAATQLPKGRGKRGRGGGRGARRGREGGRGRGRMRNAEEHGEASQIGTNPSARSSPASPSVDVGPQGTTDSDRLRDDDGGAEHPQEESSWLQNLEEDPSISSIMPDRWTASPSPSDALDGSLPQYAQSMPGHEREPGTSQALVPLQRGRSKDLAIKHSSKPGAHRFPKFDGELKGIMEEHREGFYASGQDKYEMANVKVYKSLADARMTHRNASKSKLLSSTMMMQHLAAVRQAVKLYLLHATPFSEDFRVAIKPITYTPQPDEPQLPLDEVVLRIEVREFEQIHFTMQEFLVLGRQSLAELRDKISCPSDRNLDAIKMDRKGGYFYIEGTFYLDEQGNRAIRDYPLPITEFCLANDIAAPADVPRRAAEGLPCAKKSGIEGSGGSDTDAYRKADMRLTRWDEIGTRTGPGAGYVYCHQGCCEHLLVIKDVRCLHPDDPQHASAYPACILEEAFNRRICDICQVGSAAHVTYDDRHAPTEPAFWCAECYRMMHYDQDRKLLYDHKVFPYHSG